MKDNIPDRLFYLLYNYYFKDGNYKEGIFESFIPWHFTVFILSLGSVLWTVLAVAAGVYYFSHEFINKTWAPYFVGLYLIYFFFYYAYFINNRRYRDIYEYYKNKIPGNRRKSKWVLFMVFLLPLILIMGMALVWHEII
jgi:hypothetical protein